MNRSEASAPHGGAHPPSFPGGLGKVSAREHHTARATPLIPEGTTPPVLPHSILNGHDTQETQLFEHVLSEHQHYFSVNAKAWTPFLGLISVPNFSSAPPSHALMMNRDIEHLASTAMHEKKKINNHRRLETSQSPSTTSRCPELTATPFWHLFQSAFPDL